MKKISLLATAILILLQLNLFSQEGLYNYGKFSAGYTTYILGDKVNIRKEASTKSEVLDQILIGTEVEIIEATEEFLTLNDYSEAWYKIQYNNNKSGYIWGGLLAKGYVIMEISDKFPDKEKILFGINKTEKYDKIAEIRYCSNEGKIISKIEYRAMPISFSMDEITLGYSTYASLIGKKGFSPSIDLFAIHYSFEACDYPNGEEYFYILNNKLHFAFSSAWTSNEFGSCHPDLTFPNDENGEHNVVIKTNEYVERDEEYNFKRTWKSMIKYVWSGKKFYQTQEVQLK